MYVLASSVSVQVSKIIIFGIINKRGGGGGVQVRFFLGGGVRGLEKNPKTNMRGETLIWHSRVADLHICSRMNFAHQ